MPSFRSLTALAPDLYAQSVQTRNIGDFPAAPVILGGGFWGAETGHEAKATRAIHAALDAGVNVIDTAHAYTTADHEGYSEFVLSRALKGRPEQVLVATKGGLFRQGDAYLPSGRPEAIRQQCETSLKMLQTDCLDLYQLHTVDPKVSILETLGEFAELKTQGKIRYVGLSNVSLDQLTQVSQTVDIDCVQNHLSVLSQGDLATARHCDANGIAYLAYAPLGGGGRAKSVGDLQPALTKMADVRGVTAQQVALAWLLHVSPSLLVITGATTPESVRSSAAAADLVLSESDVAGLSHG